MSRNKLDRFKDNWESDTVLEWGKPIFENIKGKWHTDFFQNNNPICVELGCGKGDYTVALAQKHPEVNYIGVDIKGSRLWKGNKLADEAGLSNVAFLRTQILLIEKFFNPNEVDEIWITFPDPRPKDRDIKRRLTSPRFMKMYQSILKEGGYLHFKSDNRDLFNYTLEEVLPELSLTDLEYTKNLYNSDMVNDITSVKTTYEKKFLAEGVEINYMKFKFAQ